MSKKKKVRDFVKVKLKVGKKLKKTTSTDTRVEAKKVVLVEQLASSSSENLSHRGLSLSELCRQLGHYNVNVRKDAVIGVRQILSSNRHLISQNLHTLIPSIARLIADEKCDGAFHAQLKQLLELLCTSSSLAMSSHFTLFMTHTLRALTHLKLHVRAFALVVINLLMKYYAELCRDSSDLFDSLIILLCSERKPTNKQQLLVDTLLALLNVYAVKEVSRIGSLRVASFSVKLQRSAVIDLTPPNPSFDFCVLGPAISRQKSPLETSDGVIRLSAAACSFLSSLIADEKNALFGSCVQIASKLSEVISNIRMSTPGEDFEEQLAKHTGPLFMIADRSEIPKQLSLALEKLRPELKNRSK